MAVDKLLFKGKQSEDEIKFASWILTCSGAFIATLLFQTGLSKLIYGGWGWFTSGDTLYVETILDGTAFSRKLTMFSGISII